MYIDPASCTDCDACVPACPVSAIFAEGDVPAKWHTFIAKNAEFFK
jgi:ferredoxin